MTNGEKWFPRSCRLKAEALGFIGPEPPGTRGSFPPRDGRRSKRASRRPHWICIAQGNGQDRSEQHRSCLKGDGLVTEKWIWIPQFLNSPKDSMKWIDNSLQNLEQCLHNNSPFYYTTQDTVLTVRMWREKKTRKSIIRGRVSYTYIPTLCSLGQSAWLFLGCCYFLIWEKRAHRR